MEVLSTTSHTIRKITAGNDTLVQDELAVEEPLEIRIKYWEKGRQIARNISVTMRTPGCDPELALGFLFTEGVVHHYNQIEKVATDPFDNNVLTVELKADEKPVLGSSERNFYTTSSCGVCGKSSIEAIKTHSTYQFLESDISVGKEILFTLKDRLREQQQVFESTGGLHASALFSPQGDFLMLREDVGRHNALDKIIGSALIQNMLPLTEKLLLLSGRASFELLQKASMAGIKIIAAIGAPSSLAVEVAEESGITLIGFLKNDGFNIYTGFSRVTEL
ncbi:Sulfur carrier protein FdhD [Dyadobacter sp. CECT 9275]|uniref:Sulfur carrier protein FdhD n=1 Tax=Dyadobacter helix TaxID=2822344 RepID=A0A916JC99_9BACT|nr:formate dehydrogenase accessory sulfurtransferase FdhD [Dyadobacter sp. CECT 9275]CAG5003781.1 Sulfur carrier protein FdhD [Dyadobacter sp. CECT 9275]